MSDVCCMGIVIADITASPFNEIPSKGTLALIDQINPGLGGCAANAAVALQKIGLHAALAGKIGRDVFGTFIRDTIAAYGTDIRGLKESEEATSAALVFVDSDGERTFLHCPGANRNFTRQDIDDAMVKDSRVLLVTGSFLLPGLDGEPTAAILRRAREAGVYTALDVVWDASGRWMELLAPCLPHLDLFIPSIDEARALSGRETVEEMAADFIQRGVGLCVIKMGKRGCYVQPADGDGFYSPAFDRIKAVDTTGAGDSFVAGFLTGIVRNWPLKECARFANATGTFCVSRVGTTEGIRSLEEIQAFIRKYDAGEEMTL